MFYAAVSNSCLALEFLKIEVWIPIREFDDK